jgi:integrase
MKSDELPPADKITLAQVFEVYSRVELPELSELSQRDIKRLWGYFEKHFGRDRLVSAVRKIDVVEWLKSRRSWCAATRVNVLRYLSRIFNYAMKNEVTDRNPFAGIEQRPTFSAKRMVTDDEWQALLRLADRPMQRLLLFLRLTGCRPGELARATWPTIDLDKATWTLHRHKTIKRTGRPRIVQLVPTVVKLLRWMRVRAPGQCRNLRQAGEYLRTILADGPVPAKQVYRRWREANCPIRLLYKARQAIGAKLAERRTVYLPPPGPPREKQSPSGHVFLNQRGRPWDVQALDIAFRKLRRAAGLAEDLSPYALRHTWITRALANRVPVKLVSHLAGHINSVVTERTYCHLDDMPEALQEAAQQAVGRRPDAKGGRA